MTVAMHPFPLTSHRPTGPLHPWCRADGTGRDREQAGKDFGDDPSRRNA